MEFQLFWKNFFFGLETIIAFVMMLFSTDSLWWWLLISSLFFMTMNYCLFRRLASFFIKNDNPTVVTQPLVIDILKFLVNHGNLPIRNAECLSIHKTLNRRHLVEQNDVVVLDLEVDGI
jgi:hypothetical protein